MKKRLLCALLALITVFLLCSCSQGQKKENSDKIKILCTLFPQYDWLRNIAKGSDSVELSLIIANGADPHSYQPTAADIMNISNCDIIVCLGGDSDNWVTKAVERSNNASIKNVRLSELEGMTLHNISSSSHSHEGHSNGEDSHEGHKHAPFDEHLYLSLRNAATATYALAEILCEKDPKNAELYTKNASDYAERLSALDREFTSSLEQADIDEPFMLFADRFPFVYLLSDYGIHYSAAFEGCSTDANADFDTVIRLIHEAEHHSVSYIAVTETSDKALANTVISSGKKKNREILTLDSMQSVTKNDITKGESYLLTMTYNLETVKKAVGIKK